MFFKDLEDSVSNVLGVATSTADMALGGEGPTREQIVRLAADGLEAAAIAYALGVGEDIVLKALD